MQIYTPFLKLKQNEVAAVADFNKNNDQLITPFFDIPRPQENNAVNIINRINTGIKQAEKHLIDSEFYIDNFDLDDSVFLNGTAQYEYLLRAIGHLSVIPVVALNRHDLHNNAALNFVAANNSKVAIRLTQEDLESYRLTKPLLLDLWKEIANANPEAIHIVLDFRVINSDLGRLAGLAGNFIDSFGQDFDVDNIIFAGSSIPAVIAELVKPNSARTIERLEVHLHHSIKAALPRFAADKFIYGDYGVVSPDYSDTELEFWLMQNVAAPKAFYPFSDNFYVVRGGAFKTHPDGYRQYFAIADSIANMKFFRGPKYSSGDKYIYDRSSFAHTKTSSSGSPGSWLKATLISHITFTVDSLYSSPA